MCDARTRTGFGDGKRKASRKCCIGNGEIRTLIVLQKSHEIERQKWQQRMEEKRDADTSAASFAASREQSLKESIRHEKDLRHSKWNCFGRTE